MTTLGLSRLVNSKFHTNNPNRFCTKEKRERRRKNAVAIPLPFSHWLSDDPQNTHRESNEWQRAYSTFKRTYLTRNSNGSLQVSTAQGLDPVLFQTSCQCVRIVSGARTSTMYRSLLRVVATGQRLQSQLFPVPALVDRNE